MYEGTLNYRKLTNDGLWPHNRICDGVLGPLAKQYNVEGVGTPVLNTLHRAFKGVRRW